MMVLATGVLLGSALLSQSGIATPRAEQPPADDSAAVAAVVAAFHAALAAGDSAGAIALLAPDVVVLEAGGSETLEEYRSSHLSADMAFSAALSSEPARSAVVVRGDVAWAWSVSRARGEFRGRAVDSDGAELMVLVRDETGWRIAAIHWSSRRRAS